MAPDYVSLTTLQKLEVFQYTLDKTTEQDCTVYFGLPAQTQRAGFERRTTYTHSLAVSSMVGHITDRVTVIQQTYSWTV